MLSGSSVRSSLSTLDLHKKSGEQKLFQRGLSTKLQERLLWTPASLGSGSVFGTHK